MSKMGDLLIDMLDDLDYEMQQNPEQDPVDVAHTIAAKRGVGSLGFDHYVKNGGYDGPSHRRNPDF